MTPPEERRLGDRIARELYRDPSYIDDPVIGEYVDGLWRSLQAGARARGELSPELDERYAWRVLLGSDPVINAFALPGGYFALNLGLVGIVTSRDELAAVLAHEMSHITQRHIPRMLGQEKRMGPMMLGAVILGAIAATRNPQAGAALAVGGQAALIQQQLNFSRDMEREADRIGYGVATQAGFEPAGFAGMFEKLQGATRLSDNGDWPYLRSHPLTTERIADMRQRYQASGQTAPAATDLETLLVAARARVLARPGTDRLRSWAGEPARADFARLPASQRAAVLYAAALAHAQLRDGARAQGLARELSTLVASDPAALRQARLLQAELAWRAGDAAQVLRLLDTLPPRAASRDPGGQAGRAERLLRAQAQMKTGQAGEAVQSLRTWVADRPGDAAAWQTLAQAYAAQGHQLRALRSEGEAQFARMDTAGAVDRMRAAQDFSRTATGAQADLIESSIVDTRLKALQELLARQREEEAKEGRR